MVWCIRQTQATFWDFEGPEQERQRVHFQDKLEHHLAHSPVNTFDAVEITDDHPVLMPYRHAWSDIYLASRAAEPARLALKLTQSVQRELGVWRSPHAYFNHDVPIKALLHAGFGLLFSGPEPLAAALGASLRTANIRFTALARAAALSWPTGFESRSAPHASAIKKASEPKFRGLLGRGQRGAETVGVQGLVAAASAAATTVAATAGAIATTVAAATTAAVATTAATGARRTCLHRTGFVHGDRAAAQGLAVHAGDRGLGFSIVAHFDETEAFGAAGFAFHHDFGAVDRAEFGKRLLQVFVTHGVRQVADVKFVAHKSSSKKHKK